ncbi:antibiotic biosynthesis monooxygenase [Ferrimonas sp. YFM]|uniref:antibiotic biosynthesis monooxygenase family protein n=1 Tax=Ferrimonas sp. YFM TaxID=3028878 RepID=UPI00257398A3|nr:antibiotic biosynthesis monooxygenase [Ferrimonas sp. YFM]BDY05530.1 antibiotic biosynthesis monooxygenase [Ferrimonas sp. YFM]
MYAVIFEVTPLAAGRGQYLDIAAGLKEKLSGLEGFISIERFQSLTQDNKLLSLSFWESEEAITQWRNQMDHMLAQQLGRNELFDSYRIRVANVVRDYSQAERAQAPA